MGDADFALEIFRKAFLEFVDAADEAVEPTQLAEADITIEPAPAIAAAVADEDEAVATLTSSETVLGADQDMFDADGDPCPVDEADLTEFTEADDQSFVEDFGVSFEAIEASPDTHRVSTLTEQAGSPELKEIAQASISTRPEARP